MTHHARTLLLALLLVLSPALARPAGAEDVAVPDTPAGALLEWFLETAAAPSEEAFEGRLGETMNDIPAPDVSVLVSALNSYRQHTDGGFVIAKVTEVDALELDVLLRAKNGRSWWIASLGVQEAPPHLISVYQLRPLVNSPLEGDESWGDLSWMLGNRPMPPGVSIRVERILEGRNKPFLRLGEGTRVAMGPASKIFPIALFAEQVAEDTTLFERLVPLRDGLVSLISPALPVVREGDTYSAAELFDYALRGDLTAVDQLIGWLGRGEVEAFVADVQGDDSPNFPFLTTGEFYKLKLLEGDLYDAYVSAENEDERRSVLVDLDWRKLPTEEEAGAIVTPTRVREVEWRASADELCDVLARIEAAMDADETGAVRAALNEVTERKRQLGIWSFVFRVSGGEPGVFAEAYLLERLDGARFRFVLLAEDPDEEIDYKLFGTLSDGIVRLMAIEP